MPTTPISVSNFHSHHAYLNGAFTEQLNLVSLMVVQYKTSEIPDLIVFANNILLLINSPFLRPHDKFILFDMLSALFVNKDNHPILVSLNSLVIFLESYTGNPNVDVLQQLNIHNVLRELATSAEYYTVITENPAIYLGLQKQIMDNNAPCRLRTSALNIFSHLASRKSSHETIFTTSFINTLHFEIYNREDAFEPKLHALDILYQLHLDPVNMPTINNITGLPKALNCFLVSRFANIEAKCKAVSILFAMSQDENVTTFIRATPELKNNLASFLGERIALTEKIHVFLLWNLFPFDIKDTNIFHGIESLLESLAKNPPLVSLADCTRAPSSSSLQERNILNIHYAIFKSVSIVWLYIARHKKSETSLKHVSTIFSLLMNICQEWNELFFQKNFKTRYQPFLDASMRSERTFTDQQAQNSASNLFSGVAFSSRVFKTLMLLMDATDNTPIVHLFRLGALYSLEFLAINSEHVSKEIIAFKEGVPPLVKPAAVVEQQPNEGQEPIAKRPKTTIVQKTKAATIHELNANLLFAPKKEPKVIKLPMITDEQAALMLFPENAVGNNYCQNVLTSRNLANNLELLDKSLEEAIVEGLISFDAVYRN